MISIRITSVGDVTPRVMGSMIRDFDRLTEDWTNAWPRVIQKFRMQEFWKFTTENADGPSGRWAALSPAYAARKAASHPGAPILTRDGALRGSLEADGAGSEVQQTSTTLFIGTSIPYAGYHQRGEGQRHRRPFIDPSERDVAEYASEIWRYFMTLKTRVGFKGRFVEAMS